MREDTFREASRLTANAFMANEKKEGSESWLAKEPTKPLYSCLFCESECGAPYLRLDDGGLVGYSCLARCINTESQEITEGGESKCLVCQMPPIKLQFDTPIGDLCLSCAKSGVETLQKVINSSASDPTTNELRIHRVVPWIYHRRHEG